MQKTQTLVLKDEKTLLQTIKELQKNKRKIIAIHFTDLEIIAEAKRARIVRSRPLTTFGKN